MIFYLGTANAAWLRRTTLRLFASHNTLRRYKTLPRAMGPWALDSGAFSEISAHGRFLTTEDEYVDAVDRYQAEIGQLEWAAPQDWMCEPYILERTGKTVREHQELTIASFLSLRDRGPFIPVLQGWETDDYRAHVGMYADAGVDLAAERLVGIGSVCRRSGTEEAARTIQLLADAGIRLHGFGLKTTAVRRLALLLDSSDSMAWSYRARRGDVQMPGCIHKRCTNCLRFAAEWRAHVLRARADTFQGTLL